MNNLGKTVEVFSAKKGQSGLPRPIVDELNIINGFGIQDDKFAGKDEDKAVMIVGTIAYEIAKKNGIKLELGSFGENILLDFNPHDYFIGTIFKIGNTVLEVTQACTICNHLSVFGNALPSLVKNCRGLYCKVLEGGYIKKDMSVKVILSCQSSKMIAS
jgi:MOSC domain-containing protein YiiM